MGEKGRRMGKGMERRGGRERERRDRERKGEGEKKRGKREGYISILDYLLLKIEIHTVSNVLHFYHVFCIEI